MDGPDEMTGISGEDPAGIDWPQTSFTRIRRAIGDGQVRGDLFVLYDEPLFRKDKPALLRVLLSRRLVEEFDDLDATTLAQTPGGPIQTVEDLLHHPQPPAVLLVRLKRNSKEFERQILDQELWETYSDPIRAIYYASLLVARTRLGAAPTTLGADDLHKCAAWALDRKRRWIDPRTRDLFRSCLEALVASRQPPPRGPARRRPGG